MTERQLSQNIIVTRICDTVKCPLPFLQNFKQIAMLMKQAPSHTGFHSGVKFEVDSEFQDYWQY